MEAKQVLALPEKLAAARFALIKGTSKVPARPYLATALFAFQPYEVEGSNNLTADKYWRLYFDPDFVESKTVPELATILYHITQHLLRDHAARAKTISADPNLWELAADAEINDGIKAEGFTFPKTKDEETGKMVEDAIFPETLHLPSNLLSEEYYTDLEKNQSSQMPMKNEGQQEINGSPGSESSTNNSNEPKNGSDRNDSNNQNNQNNQQNGQDGRDSSQEENNNNKSTNKNVCHGNCGSCAGGEQQPYELGEPNGSNGGMNEVQSNLIRKKTADDVQSYYEKNPGKVPDSLKKWAEELHSARIPWQKVLASKIRKSLSVKKGLFDYSRRRPNRRQSAYGSVVMPSMVEYIPKVSIIMDSSGSMRSEELRDAFSEAVEILKRIGVENAKVISCDTEAHVLNIKSYKDLVKKGLIGGGGTDMGIGIAKAKETKPRPDITIILTDGFTPWPKTKPFNSEFITVLCGDNAGKNSCPDWMDIVEVDK